MGFVGIEVVIDKIDNDNIYDVFYFFKRFILNDFLIVILKF